MNRIPFDAYDFFGYLASGLVIIAGMELVLGFPPILGRDLKLIDSALLVLGVYVAGQLVAWLAKATLEDGLVDKLLGRPSVNLFLDRPPRIRGFIFRDFYKPLTPSTKETVLARASSHGVLDVGEPLFQLVRFSPTVRGDVTVMARMDSFRNKYGLNRNLALASLAVGIGLVIRTWWIRPDPALARWAGTALIVGVMLVYRFLKFYRLYSLEMFNVYGNKEK